MKEWSEEPEYPPLNDASRAGLRRQVRLDWYESLKAKPTAEQKLHDISVKSTHCMAHINNWLPSANSLPFVKYLTRTHLINSLPVGYDIREPESDEKPNGDQTNGVLSCESKVRQIVLDQIALSNHEAGKRQDGCFVTRQVRDGNVKAYVSNRLIEQIANQVKRILVYETNPQLLDYQMDLSPAIRSWWYHSGFEPPNKKLFYVPRKDKEGNVNTIFQMDGSSALNMRSEHMIAPIIDMDDTLVNDTTLVEKCNYDPKYFGANYKFKWPVALPGFWFEETPKYDCPHTCFLSTDCLHLRKILAQNFVNQFNDDGDCLAGQAILTAFGWLNSLSMYHGFTPYHEVHYPFTCQVITTDGQRWMFNVYQLNSHTFHRDLGGPKRNNICWSSGVMKLYEDYQGGNFQGVNNDVISLLVKFMSKQTSAEYTGQLNLRPYIHDDDRSQEEKDKMRKELRDCYEGRMNKWIATQWFVPEWERIYFRSRVTRHQIFHMKPKWHPPKPQYPREFE